MKPIREQVLSEIERFLEKHNMSPAEFGQKVKNDTRFVYRLRQGADIRGSTIDAIRKLIHDYG